MNSMRRQKDRTLKEELPRSVGAQYATGDQWGNNSRKNEGLEPKQNQSITLLKNNILLRWPKLRKYRSKIFNSILKFGGGGAE